MHRFIHSYDEITKTFTYLLKKYVSFFWDDEAQCLFDVVKHALTHAPLLHPLDYTWDYFLYPTASNTTIGMVLAQDTNDGEEHVFYYLSKSLTSPKLHYTNIEKLALVVVLAIQRFCHYIFLHKTTIIADSNPM